jgi:chlorite dismutase
MLPAMSAPEGPASPPPPAGHGHAPSASHGASSHAAREEELVIDVNEYGAPRDGVRQAINQRLFMQLLVFTCANGKHPDSAQKALISSLTDRGIPSVVYQDANDPRGLALLTWSLDPAHFVTTVRPVFAREELRDLVLRPEFTMLGRSYSTGYEQDLEHWILRRPAETATDPKSKWAVWYPLRRSGAFAKLEPREQGAILREHGTIGKAYGGQGLAHDIRLACHGLDAKDNEFLIGLIGSELHPLSHVVQSMRKTKQTSEYISQMGPFFVGYAVHQALSV